MSAGFVATNDETGGSALKFTGEIRVPICGNGLTIDIGQFRQVHMGAKMDSGQVSWSADTREANVQLISKQARDAVRTFLSADYLNTAVSALEAAAGYDVDKPAETIAVVARELAYSDAEQEAILSEFIKGGQCTSGGIMQAVTSAAQDIADIERANDVGASGVRAMEVAARLVRTGR